MRTRNPARRTRFRWPPGPRPAAASWLLGGLVCLSPAAVAFLLVPDIRAREHAHRTARPCPTSLPAEAVDCALEFPATAAEVRTVTVGRASLDYEARLTSERGEPFRVRFDAGRPIAAGLRPGDQVTARLWRGDVTSVSRLDATQATTRAPGGAIGWALLPGWLLAAVAVHAVWCGTWILRHTESYRAGRTSPLTIAAAVLAGTLPILLLAATVTYLFDGPPWLPALFGVCCLAALRTWLRPSDARHAAR
ncbi:hypothetical protein [Streptomyces sp. NPDC059979]|uniref:hypothetical protein n=1 Tax=Streptomyces sp. NPDC059979 TaxID=3347021 RepID=UPI00367D3839